MDTSFSREGSEVVELVAAIGNDPFGDGFFHILHEGLGHHVEAEEKAKERKEEGISDVNSALEVCLAGV